MSYINPYEAENTYVQLYMFVMRNSGYYVVILSIVEGDCEGYRWALLATRKTGFGAYWHHRQSLDRLGMPRV